MYNYQKLLVMKVAKVDGVPKMIC